MQRGVKYCVYLNNRFQQGAVIWRLTIAGERKSFAGCDQGLAGFCS